MVIAVEHEGKYILNPDANTVFTYGDIVWFVSPREVSLEAFTAKDKKETTKTNTTH